MHPNLLRQLQEEVNLSNDLPGLIQNLSALLSMARKRNQERLRDIHHAEVAMKIQELKKLRPQSLLYCRCTGPLLGESVRKIKDGKTHMVVAGIGKQWRVPYEFLQLTPVDSVTVKLTKILSDRL